MYQYSRAPHTFPRDVFLVAISWMGLVVIALDLTARIRPELISRRPSVYVIMCCGCWRLLFPFDRVLHNHEEAEDGLLHAGAAISVA
jgi:hypothetical protein